MTVSNVTRSARTDETCQACGSTSLFSGWFDADGYAFPFNHDTPPEHVPPGIRWTTYCNDCGEETKP